MSKAIEALVESNIHEIADGFCWVLMGKYQSTRGYRKFDMVCVNPETADRCEFGDMRRLLADDPSAILFNGYENAWVGVDGLGGVDEVSPREVAKRLANAYRNGLCRATGEDIDALMPKELYEEIMEEQREIWKTLRRSGKYTAEQLAAMGMPCEEGCRESRSQPLVKKEVLSIG